MKVARYYHVSRVQKDSQPFPVLEVTNTRADALAISCYLVTGQQRVFVDDSAASGNWVEVDCAKQRVRFTLNHVRSRHGRPPDS